jgi:hypothetical protein
MPRASGYRMKNRCCLGHPPPRCIRCLQIDQIGGDQRVTQRPGQRDQQADQTKRHPLRQRSVTATTDANGKHVKVAKRNPYAAREWLPHEKPMPMSASISLRSASAWVFTLANAWLPFSVSTRWRFRRSSSEPERMTQTELAQLLGLEDASMVPLVDRLVKQSLWRSTARRQACAVRCRRWVNVRVCDNKC